MIELKPKQTKDPKDNTDNQLERSLFLKLLMEMVLAAGDDCLSKGLSEHLSLVTDDTL